MKDLLKQLEKKDDNYSEGGIFRPLSVWERKGFNISDIQNTSPPEDVRSHAVLGETYRVRLESLTRTHISAIPRSKRLCVQQAPPGMASSFNAPPAASFRTASLTVGNATAEAPQLAIVGGGAFSSADGLASIQASVAAHTGKQKYAAKAWGVMKKCVEPTW